MPYDDYVDLEDSGEEALVPAQKRDYPRDLVLTNDMPRRVVHRREAGNKDAPEGDNHESQPHDPEAVDADQEGLATEREEDNG